MGILASKFVLIGGGGLDCVTPKKSAISFFIQQIDSPNPKIGFLGTAAGDDPLVVSRFNQIFSNYNCERYSFSFFERVPSNYKESIMSMDAIYVGGGNTKSMLAVWREWGIDKLLNEYQQADKVLGGESAGAMCWFKEGFTDSYANSFQKINCLSFIPYSFSPHSSPDSDRNQFFKSAVKEKVLIPGIALGNYNSIVIHNNKIIDSENGLDVDYEIVEVKGLI